MFEKLTEILNNSKAEYSDIRYEKKTTTNIVFNGKELKTIGANSTDGFVIRVLKKGGFATIAFTHNDIVRSNFVKSWIMACDEVVA